MSTPILHFVNFISYHYFLMLYKKFLFALKLLYLFGALHQSSNEEYLTMGSVKGQLLFENTYLLFLTTLANINTTTLCYIYIYYAFFD